MYFKREKFIREGAKFKGKKKCIQWCHTQLPHDQRMQCNANDKIPVAWVQFDDTTM